MMCSSPCFRDCHCTKAQALPTTVTRCDMCGPHVAVQIAINPVYDTVGDTGISIADTVISVPPTTR